MPIGIIKLSGLKITDPTRPVIADLSSKVKAISSLYSWVTFDEDSVTLDASGLIQAVTDQSGNGRGFAQATAAYRPKWVDGVVNDRPVARFAGSAASSVFNRLDFTGALPSSGDLTKIAVLKLASTAGGVQQILTDLVPAATKHVLQVNNATLQTANGNTSGNLSYPTALDASAFHVVAGSQDFADKLARVKLDEGAVTSGAMTATGFNTTMYLGASETPTYPLAGDVAEVLVFNADLLADAHADDLAAVMAYLQARFAI
ncbi:hypothetical protein SAMN05216548_110155 [Faunimonas pinastri]|uniref:Uncharacterized protein n=1 Tax=Faunimonas pinastri TaxID=1855383 RepID=A0A1H9L1M5_9HYPH|nr:hypothetical protein [Faunimonas pinastri]SER05159.1 hypothetical protein SAMN05216548_110155 [Faunimonas pinastri]